MPEQEQLTGIIIDVNTKEETIVSLTDEELAERAEEALRRPAQLEYSMRVKRDRLLAETDWWVVGDRTATAEQLAYRQALRDLPANTTDPENPAWPVKPE
jgi:hypothetical protein